MKDLLKTINNNKSFVNQHRFILGNDSSFLTVVTYNGNTMQIFLFIHNHLDIINLIPNRLFVSEQSVYFCDNQVWLICFEQSDLLCTITDLFRTIDIIDLFNR